MSCLTLSKVFAAFCGAATFASWLVCPAVADVITINAPQESSAGTYFYPQNEFSHNFEPGYFYASTDGSVTFSISAPDGATLHIFDDAAGTNELPVPATLQQAGQARADDFAVNPQRAEVYLTQGWHKCYVELNQLSVRTGDEALFSRCQLSYSTGILYDKVQSVDAAYAFDPWEIDENGTYVCTGTVTFTLPSGEPAVGDGVSCNIGKVTSDIEGSSEYSTVSPETTDDLRMPLSFLPKHYGNFCPTPSSGLVTMNADSTTDNEGKIHVTLRWNGTSLADQTAYVWMQFVNNARADLANGSSDGVAFQAPPMVTYYGGPVKPYKIVLYPNHTRNTVFNHTAQFPFWGHRTDFVLQVVNQNGNGWASGYVSETFANFKLAKTCPSDQATVAPGIPQKDIPIPPAEVGYIVGVFGDTNGGTTNIKDTGGSTLWYTVDQQWSVATPYIKGPTIYKLNTHHLTCYQNSTTRTY